MKTNLSVYGPDSFFVINDDAKISRLKEGHSYRLMAEGSVAVHLTWLVKGYEHCSRYSGQHMDVEIADWCCTHANGGYIMHPNRAVLFKDESIATAFKLTWS